MRPMVSSIPLLRKIREANEHWFTPANKRFFQDVNYFGYYGGKTGKSYLMQSTYHWSDMFDNPKKLCYVIHELNQETEEIGSLVDITFKTLTEAKEWLREN